MSIIKSSLINLKGHKLRVFVTLLWIIMGITSSILVSSIGNGLKKEVTDSVSRVNPNKTRIYFESSDSNMANMETFLNPFKLEDIDELSFIEGVERIGASKDDFSMGSMYYSDAYFDKKTTYVDKIESMLLCPSQLCNVFILVSSAACLWCTICSQLSFIGL